MLKLALQGAQRIERDTIGTFDSMLSMNISGVGLGLSTCKKIAEAIHGDIFLMDDES